MNRIAEQSVPNMAGGMSVTKNKFIEEWAYKRENAEKYFKYSRANWARLAIFGFAVPFAVYNLITSEMVRSFHVPFLARVRLTRWPEKKLTDVHLLVETIESTQFVSREVRDRHFEEKASFLGLSSQRRTNRGIGAKSSSPGKQKKRMLYYCVVVLVDDPTPIIVST